MECRRCGVRLTADQLVRHERGRVLVVHCPECGCGLGRYRRHGQGPDRSVESGGE